MTNTEISEIGSDEESDFESESSNEDDKRHNLHSASAPHHRDHNVQHFMFLNCVINKTLRKCVHQLYINSNL